MIDASKIGTGFVGTRNDGRVFKGIVQDVRYVDGKGTLIVFRQDDGSHRSVYAETLTGWDCSPVNQG
mgnify:CR=1 FL=1